MKILESVNWSAVTATALRVTLIVVLAAVATRLLQRMIRLLRERLTRKEKSELKLLTAKKLRRQMSPNTRMVDLSWSIEEGIVRFFSHATKPAGAMMELFTKTFGLKLVPESPYTLAARLGLSKAQERAWHDLEAMDLAEDAELRDEAAEEE